MSVINHRVDALEEALYSADLAIQMRIKALKENEQLSLERKRTTKPYQIN